MKNIVMTGSKNWQDRVKIKDTIFDLKNRLGEDLHVIGGGDKVGADYNVRKYSLSLDINYSEVPPFNSQWNQYCMDPANRYWKEFNPKYIFMRNKLLADRCDMLILFLESSEDIPITTEDLIAKCNKQGKPVLIIN